MFTKSRYRSRWCIALSFGKCFNKAFSQFVDRLFLGASAPNPKLKIAKLPIAFVWFF